MYKSEFNFSYDDMETRWRLMHNGVEIDLYESASLLNAKLIRIAELEKELDSANLVIAKIANNIIDLDDFEQDSHQAVHCWDDIKEFALLTLGRCDS
jgi:hypothetical protein